jgi:hypothetical protein
VHLLATPCAANAYGDAADWVTDRTDREVRAMAREAAATARATEAFLRELRAWPDREEGALVEAGEAIRAAAREAYGRTKAAAEREATRGETLYSRFRKYREENPVIFAGSRQDNALESALVALEKGHERTGLLAGETEILLPKRLEEVLDRAERSNGEAFAAVRGAFASGIAAPLEQVVTEMDLFSDAPFNEDEEYPLPPVTRRGVESVVRGKKILSLASTALRSSSDRLGKAAASLLVPADGPIWIASDRARRMEAINDRVRDLQANLWEPRNVAALLRALDESPSGLDAVEDPAFAEAVAKATRSVSRGPEELARLGESLDAVASRLERLGNPGREWAEAEKAPPGFALLFRNRGDGAAEKRKGEVRRELFRRYSHSPWIFLRALGTMEGQIGRLPAAGTASESP